MITDTATCEQAAAALGLSDTTADESTSTYDAPGCVFKVSSYSSDTLNLYPPTNTYSCSSTRQCVCAFHPPSAPSPPSAPPAPPSPPSLPPGYLGSAAGFFLLSSGSCGDAMITDTATCEQAAAALGLSDTTAYEW